VNAPSNPGPSCQSNSDRIEHWERDARLLVAYGGPDSYDDARAIEGYLMAALKEITSLRKQHWGAVDLLREAYEIGVGAVDRTNPDQKRELHRLSLLLDRIEPHLPRGGQ
jgi:FMN phosphatase YigB (HAD superfamily)